MKLSAAIDLYIAKRQAMGETFYSPAAVLRALSRSHGEIELSSLTSDQVSSFLSGPRTGPATWRHKYGTLRVFFEHWRVREELHLAPLPPPAPKYTTSFVPYIYSVSELRLLLAAVPCCQRREECLMSSSTFRTLLLLLYGTGCASVKRCGCVVAMSILARASSPSGERSCISRDWFRWERTFTHICERMLRCRGEWIATINRSSNPAYTSRFHVRWLKSASGSCAILRAFAGKRAAPISPASTISGTPSRFTG